MRQSDLDNEGSRREFWEVLAEFDTPAYVQRGQRTEAAWQQFMTYCQMQREQRLEFSRFRLAKLAALIQQQWFVVDAHARLSEDDESTAKLSEYLGDLHHSWQPELRISVSPTSAPKRIRRALVELSKSFQRFNANWQRFLDRLDFTEINQVRADYNNYYVCEKAAAFQSERIASHGFIELRPVVFADVLDEHPLLSVPIVH